MVQGGEALLEIGRKGWYRRAASGGAPSMTTTAWRWSAPTVGISCVHSLPHEYSMSVGQWRDCVNDPKDIGVAT